MPSIHRPLAAGLALAATLLAASSASAATLSITPSTRQAVGGLPLSVKITSDTAGEIVIRQARIDKRDFYPGCYAHREADVTTGPWVGSAARKTITYSTPGVPVTVRLNSGQIEFFGGDILSFAWAAAPSGKRCYDPPTQFTRISAWQYDAAEPSVALAPLVRIL